MYLLIEKMMTNQLLFILSTVLHVTNDSVDLYYVSAKLPLFQAVSSGHTQLFLTFAPYP